MRRSSLKDGRNPFMHQVRMASAVAVALDEGYVLIVDDLIFQGEVSNLLRQHPIRIRNLYMHCILKAGIGESIRACELGQAWL